MDISEETLAAVMACVVLVIVVVMFGVAGLKSRDPGIGDDYPYPPEEPPR